MKSAKSTAFSGCLIWFILITVIGACIMPVAFVAGSLSSFSDYAIKTTGNWTCPANTAPESYSYETTTTDENGFSRPATAYELHCVDSSGSVIKNDPVFYAFIWIGLFALIGAIVTGVLAFVFAVPGGMLITRLLENFKSSKPKTSI